MMSWFVAILNWFSISFIWFIQCAIILLKKMNKILIGINPWSFGFHVVIGLIEGPWILSHQISTYKSSWSRYSSMTVNQNIFIVFSHSVYIIIRFFKMNVYWIVKGIFGRNDFSTNVLRIWGKIFYILTKQIRHSMLQVKIAAIWCCLISYGFITEIISPKYNPPFADVGS